MCDPDFLSREGAPSEQPLKTLRVIGGRIQPAWLLLLCKTFNRSDKPA